MSNQNGKKSGSANNSSGNTPSTTPVTTVVNSGPNQPNSNPTNNAPKYGTLIPNRIFVGGISANTTEAELLELFSKYGTVKAAKIIQDRAGVSKGYGFITFETEEEAKRLQKESDNITLKERRLNIAPAIKKQPFSRTYETNSPPTINSAPAQYYIPTSGLPYFQSGVTYYTPPPQPQPGDPNSQQPPIYPSPAVYQPPAGPPQAATYPPSMIYPTQPMYMPQQFSYQPVPYDYNYYSNGNPQFMVGNQGAPQHQQLQVQPPGSPTRTSCFNPQLPYGSDTVYINVPMFGTVEGPPMYQDAIDMNNGNLAEEACGITKQPFAYRPPSLLQSQSPLHHAEIAFASEQDNVSRTSTPVVSVLTLEQRQEKDIRSMQSGRRPRTPEKFANSYGANNQVPFNNNNLFGSSDFTAFTQMQNMTVEEFGGPRQNDLTHEFPRRPNFVTKNHDNQSASVQTNSRYQSFNTSASFKPSNFDENRKVDTGGRHNFNSNSITYHNSRNTLQNGRRGGYHNNNNNNNYSYQNRYNEPKRTDHHSTNNNHNHNNRPVTWHRQQEYNNHNHDNPSSQIPTPSGGSQNFIPPSRRNKRSVRRSTHSGTPLSEIGAGDAPLPAVDVGDCSKKLDNLKL